MKDWSKRSLIKVMASRPGRIEQSPTIMSDEENERLLKTFHPDHVGKERPIRIGPNANDCLFPLEMADLLEADSSLPISYEPNVSLETDVLIIGGGGAGVSAGLVLAGSGLDVHLATKLRLGDSNTIMAEGGIQAALSPKDSSRRHFADSFVGGHGKNDKNILRLLCESGPETIQWLTQLGCLFDQKLDGNLHLSSGGGTSIPRILKCRDYTGLEIMRVLREALLESKTKILENHAAVELMDDGEGQVTGAIFWNSISKNLLTVSARAVLLATGGCGQLRYHGFDTSNHFGATGDGLILAYRQGCSLLHPSSCQYHPSGILFPDALLGQLVTEGIRSIGAQILNSEGKRFVDEMSYRDLVSAAIIRECQEGRGIETPSEKTGVWLDTPLIDIKHGKGTLRYQFPGLMHRFERYNIQPDQQPILVYPTQHYQNGGIRIDPEGRTDKIGLWAAGEVSGGVHGVNRLMGNSLLDIVVFGRRSGASIERNLPKRKSTTLSALKRFRYERSKLENLPKIISPQLYPLESKLKMETSISSQTPKPDSPEVPIGKFVFEPPDPFIKK